jgi:glycerophosphoryl diester phosphodiesterase
MNWNSMLLMAVTLAMATSIQPADTAEPMPAEYLVNMNRTLVIAHRGYSTFAPENTMPAFQYAIKAGADLVELDYHHSRDGVPIVIHDDTVDRTTDAAEHWKEKQIRVSSRDAAELQTLDAGAWFNPAFHGIRLPLLSEALNVIQKGSVTLIERKAGDALTCVRMLRDLQLVNHVVVQSFDWGFLRDFHAQEPRQILGALGPPGVYRARKLTDEEKILNRDWIEAIKGIGARIVVWNRQVTGESVREAQRQGLKVWIYTINDPELASWLIDLGVDGIITDNPSLIWRTIALRDTR